MYSLLSDNNNFVKHAMKSIINRVDSSGNTAIHYAKHYPNQEVVKLLLRYLGVLMFYSVFLSVASHYSLP